jgi:hypothetical protein
MKSLEPFPKGAAQPVFVAGIRYRSIFEAAIETDISATWISLMLKASGGFPVLIKRHMVAPEQWVHSRITLMGGWK